MIYFLFNDSTFLGQQNAPTLSDSFTLQEGVSGISSGCFLVFSDNVNNFNDSYTFTEGFVSVGETLNDSISIQDEFFIVLPNVTLQLTFNDMLSFTDLVNISDKEMLNSYLRRYLNDVIQN